MPLKTKKHWATYNGGRHQTKPTNNSHKISFTKLAGAVEYTDYFSAEV